MSPKLHWTQDTNGNVAILVAIGLTVILGCAGGAIDYARALQTKSRLALAADAAALAAAASGEGDRIAIARAYFTQNGGGTVVPSIDVSGDIVRVEASDAVPTTLLHAIGITRLNVSTLSEAAIDGETDGPLCILLLRNDKIGLFANSHSTLDADCGVHINSSDKEALYVNSRSSVEASSIHVHGQAFLNNGTATPAPAEGTPRRSDPLASLREPAEADAGCDFNDFTVNNGETAVIAPGVYCKKTAVNSGATLIMQPGTYVFRGGPLEINSGSTLTASEVTLFFKDKDAYLKVNSHSDFHASAPRSGYYAGILIFQGRDAQNDGAPPFIFNSNGSGKLEGTIYLPLGTLEINSHSRADQTAAYTAIVARDLTVNSFASLAVRSNFSGPTPLPALLSSFRNVRHVRLIK